MSRAKDRARAESGLIYRNGKLWNKTDWAARLEAELKAEQAAKQPTPAQVAEQEKVDTAVADMVKNIPEKTATIPDKYYCTACRGNHVKPSKNWQRHQNFILRDGV